MLQFETLTRQLAEAHMAELLAIIKDEPHEYWEATHFLHELPNKWQRSMIAFEDDRVAGFIIANDRSASNTHINKFMVAPMLRGKGVGKQLLIAFCDSLPVTISNLTLKVYQDNEKAQQFYLKNHFHHLVCDGELLHMAHFLNPINRVGIHQPNFIPWGGYFSKMFQSSVFVLLDDVQFTKNSYINRVQCCIHGKASWLTIAVKNSGLQTPIDKIALHDFDHHSKKILKSLFYNYQKTSHFDAVYSEFERIFRASFSNLAELNIALIAFIRDSLELSTLLIRSSQIRVQSEEEDATQRLIAICKLTAASTYVSGSGGFGYQDVNRFHEQGITIEPVQYKPLPYPQRHEDFIPNLSIIDALFNIGFEGTAELLKSSSGR